MEGAQRGLEWLLGTQRGSMEQLLGAWRVHKECTEGAWKVCGGHAEGFRMIAMYIEGSMEWLLDVQRVCRV